MIWFFAKKITKPIEELVIATNELNQGNLDKEININAKDEINKLVTSFKLMVERIKSTMASRDELIKEINTRKQLEEANLAMELNLRNQQKLESIGVLASGVAHEINNPLNGILNYSQLISDVIKDKKENCEDTREEIDEYSNQIITETNRISGIVNNLLQFSRKNNLAFRKSNIKNIIDDTLSLTNTILKQDQITIEVDVSENIPFIECRPQQLQQVVMNLLTNAHDALNEKHPNYSDNKKIELKVRSTDNGIRITVKDYGNGIAKEAQSKIFDPFFTTKDRSKGTGLGLSISYGIIEEHNGKLSFESVEGSYTEFHADLPFVQPLKES